MSRREARRPWGWIWAVALGLCLGWAGPGPADYLVLLDTGKELRVKRYREEGGKIHLWLMNGRITVPREAVKVIVSLDPRPSPAKAGKGKPKPKRPVPETTRSALSRDAVEPTDLHGRGEAWWRARVKRLREAIRQAEEDLAFVEKEIASLEARLKQPDLLQGAFYEEARDRLGYYRIRRAEIKLSLERLRRKLDVELPEEARKAGAWPGWLRE